MALEEQWLPSLISAGALGLVWYDMRRCRAEMKVDTDKLDGRIKLLEQEKPKRYFEDVAEDYMTKEEHDLLCKSKGQEFTITIMKSIQQLKDEIFPELRAIHDAIKGKHSATD